MNRDPAVGLLNRYIDILPFEDTRVQLAGLGYDTYINANYLHSPLGLDMKLIAAQGPKDNTVGHFWRMIYE